MEASEVMTPEVETIRPDATVLEGARTILRRGVSGLPVVDSNGQLVGAVTEGDFLRRAEDAKRGRFAYCGAEGLPRVSIGSSPERISFWRCITR
jgi:CBS-domain-containing membrane protein